VTSIQLFDFQRADVDNLLAHDATGFVVAETGAGKTIIGAAAAAETGLRTKLIIAPPGTFEKVWRKTITGFTDTDPDSPSFGEWVEGLDPEAPVLRIEGTNAGREALDALEWRRPGYYLMSHQVFTRWKPTHLRPDVTVLDEAHLFGNRESTGGQALHHLESGHRMLMSGTMLRNQFENFWNLLRWAYPDRDTPGDISDPAFRRWQTTYCATKYDRFAAGNIVTTGEAVPGTIANRIPCYVQHFKRQQCCEFHPKGFLHDLPAPITITETVELTAGQRKAIRQLEDDYLAWLEYETAEALAKKQKRALIVKLPLTKTIRLSQMTLAMPSLRPAPWQPRSARDLEAGKPQRQYFERSDGFKQAVDKDGNPVEEVFFAPDADSPKLDRLVEIFHKVGEPMVVATTSQKFAQMCIPRLAQKKIRAFEWSSANSQKRRDEALVEFKRGEWDIIFGVTEAIATGIDGLQDVAGVLVSLNKSRDKTVEVQLEGRLDRRGQKRTEGVIHYEVIAEGSADEDIISEQIEWRLSMNKTLRRQLNRNGGKAA
jgi:hypothetical protein